MIFNKERRNLFDVDKDYHLAHCISADWKLGAGIAYEFKRKFSGLASVKPFTYPVGKAVLIHRVFNLITKNRYFNKPNYVTLKNSLEDMKNQCLENNITKLAMPKIGCGLDGLSWGVVENSIKEVFKDTEIEILVCTYK